MDITKGTNISDRATPWSLNHGSQIRRASNRDNTKPIPNVPIVN
jgi:hypothetical protein